MTGGWIYVQAESRAAFPVNRFIFAGVKGPAEGPHGVDILPPLVNTGCNEPFLVLGAFVYCNRP